MKVYDCFPFYNELDLLEIRLNELNDVVDYFVLTEAEKSHKNHDKPLYYSEALEEDRFLRFKDKIIHEVVPGDEFVDDSWLNERHQFTTNMMTGIEYSEDDDLIISGAVDEIPNPDSFLKFKGQFDGNGVFRFEQKNHYFYLDTLFDVDDRSTSRMRADWYGTCVSTKKTLIQSPYKLSIEDRANAWQSRHTGLDYNMILNGGWHFSYCGDALHNINKIHNFAHQEFNHLTVDDMKKSYDNLLDPCERVGEYKAMFIGHSPIETLPKYIQNNVTKFKRYLHQL